METLSGLTPALSRRLQKQLLAQLPPAAARTLRRTLSMQNTGSTRDRQKYTRSHSASKSLTNDDPATDISRLENSTTDSLKTDVTDSTSVDNNKLKVSNDLEPAQQTTSIQKEVTKTEDDEAYLVQESVPQFSTLPRPKRQSSLSRESTPPITTNTDAGYDFSHKFSLPTNKDTTNSRGSSIRSTPDRPLLSKYLTPERTTSLDESYSSDSGSLLSEPSYIAAYGTPTIAGLSGLGMRRHSMRLTTDTPKKRISRFLRPDFFEAPHDESVYVKHKKEKELETQKVLREIREKKNKTLDTSFSSRNAVELQESKDDNGSARKCLSPIGIITSKERSRSNTPFFPILDNIKELDNNQIKDIKGDKENIVRNTDESVMSMSKESKLIRPKSYPVKADSTLNDVEEEVNHSANKECESNLYNDSKLLRPKSYPASSPSPEKVYISRKKAESSKTQSTSLDNENNTDVEVSFSVSLPKKTNANETKTTDTCKKDVEHADESSNNFNNVVNNDTVLVLKKYQVMNNTQGISKDEKLQSVSNVDTPLNGNVTKLSNKVELNNKVDQQFQSVAEDETKQTKKVVKKEDTNIKKTNSETDANEKKPTIKKKIIRKVSSKSKTDNNENQEKNEKSTTEKKKIIKKPKEKVEENSKSSKENVIKKKSMLQSIGHKLEKLASTKSSSFDKASEVNLSDCTTKKSSKLSRNQREQSVPIQSEQPNESNVIKRAVTLTDVAALEGHQNSVPTKTTVSKVLGLFRKSDSKEKSKLESPKSSEINIEPKIKDISNDTTLENIDSDKPKRPTSLLLNGLGRKNKYTRTTSDSVSVLSMPNTTSDANTKKEESKNFRNSLKLDFSRLPRVKKIVPTNPVIEPQIMDTTCFTDNDREREKSIEQVEADRDRLNPIESIENRIRSRSRSKSDNSNPEISQERNSEDRDVGNSVSTNDNAGHQPLRNHEPTTPEREDIVERIRRKSFYTRFNEKRQRRKSNLVGPGAAEYDPLARLHSQSDPKYDTSPTSPVGYDLSPGYSSAVSDLSPSTERYRPLMTDLPVASRNSLRFDNFGLHDKVNSYRSLDRNDFRKYPSSRSYLDYDTPTSTYGHHRYNRTLSLLDSSDGADESLSHLREPQKYNRTLSMYAAPGSYATYRPKRVRNSAIILKESEKEPSPENILDKIRQKKISISVTRKPDPDKESQIRCVFLYIFFHT